MHLEERLRQAELGPDLFFFEDYLAADAVLDGQKLKSRIIEASARAGSGQKSTKVEMRNVALSSTGRWSY